VSGQQEPLEAKLNRLAQELERLSQRVDFLYSYLRVPRPESMEAPAHLHPLAPADEEIIRWADRASLLPRVSTVCFLMVVALGLRTLTDNNVLDTRMGSMIGMGYAAALMLAGYLKYRKGSRLAAVLAVCGALLMYSIVVESHARFHSLDSVAAYATLLATGLGMAATSHRFSTSPPALVGILGMCLASAAIDYPNPFFPFLTGIFLTANLLGWMLTRVQWSSWMRWTILLLTIFVLTVWSSKLAIALGKKEQELPAFLALHWFLPSLGLFALLYPAISLAGTIREGVQRASSFDSVVPSLAGIWSLAVAYQVVDAWGQSTRMLGLAGGILAIAHMVAAHWLAARPSGGARGTNSFALAACLILALGLPLLAGSHLLALAFLSATAFGLSVLAGTWRSGGVRLTSYMLQGYAGVVAGLLLWERGQGSDLLAQTAPAGFITCLGVLHYRWCRTRRPAPESSVFFSRYDKEDRSVILPLVGSLLSGFFAFRAVIQDGLYLSPGDFENSFGCAQSILINVTAAGLMVYAYIAADQGARNLAIVVTLVGGVRVFMFDLLQARGVPLVLSVFSFGLAALLESAVLGRWQRRAKEGLQASAQLKPPPREA
jgi:hypothetical protein